MILRQTLKFSFSLLLIFISVFAAAENIGYAEYTLENGMHIFVLEDFASAPVEIALSVRAGINAQNKSNTGFFTLYSRLLKYAGKNEISSLLSECGMDSAVYRLSVNPELFENALQELSSHVFAPQFTDKDIADRLALLRKEASAYSESPEGFINSAIDARVFSAAPWKLDSGIYPSILKNISLEDVRTVLSGISENFYVPNNSALFISGCIKKEIVLSIAKKIFGAYPSKERFTLPFPAKAGGQAHKFVLYDPRFSEDMTQVVIQYTSLDMNQAALTAAALNQGSSDFINRILERKLLNICGQEYINVSAAHKSASSRLIIQTLLEKPLKAQKTDAAEQAELFFKTVKENIKNIDDVHYAYAKRLIKEAAENELLNSSSYMKELCAFWSIERFTSNQEIKTLSQRFDNALNSMMNENTRDIPLMLENETPFIFVIVGSKTYKNSKGTFKKYGYNPVNKDSAAWYTKKTADFSGDTADIGKTEINQNHTENYIKQNRAQISCFTLKNGIPACVKFNEKSKSAAVLLEIKNGKAADKINGFSELMTGILALNIQKELEKQRAAGNIDFLPEVKTETSFLKSTVSFECKAEDLTECIKCAAEALIFGEISPVQADRVAHSVRSAKRVYNALPENQLFRKAVQHLYKNPAYLNAFDSENEVLEKITYNDVAAFYPLFIDASRYKIFIAGKAEQENIKSVLESTIGLLTSHNTGNDDFSIDEPDFQKSKKISVKLRHLFYTDVSKGNAGNRPAVLVPTKTFSDPVQFWLPAPKFNSNEAKAFEALLRHFSKLLEKDSADFASGVKLTLPSKELNAAVLTFMGVSKASEVDRIYAEVGNNLIKALESESAAQECAKIKDNWFSDTLANTETNAGTVLLMSGDDTTDAYLRDYENIFGMTSDDFLLVAKNRILEMPPLRLYSEDSRK
ncbi:MAG: insulinase family protein [Treponema sp.]